MHLRALVLALTLAFSAVSVAPPPAAAGLTVCFTDRSGAPVPGVEFWLSDGLVGTSGADGCLSGAAVPAGQHDFTLFFTAGHGNNGMRGGWQFGPAPQRVSMQVDAQAPLPESLWIRPPVAVPPARDTTVQIEFDHTVPAAAREYISRLAADLDPVLAAFAGPPLQSGTLAVTYDPTRYMSLNADLTALNISRLPDSRFGNDPEFDSWFIVEYFHTFLRGREVPVITSRSFETLGQTMKAVAGLYLHQQGGRRMLSRSLPYYLKLRPVLETLGPGILINTGPDKQRNPGVTPGAGVWEDAAYHRMNPFTLEYGVSVWLTLADAAARHSGEFDFFRRFQDAMWAEDPQTPEAFFDLISRAVGGTVDGQPAGEWLRQTALFQPLPSESLFIRPLPVQSSFWYMTGMDDPDRIYVFAVQRAPARLAAGQVTVSIVDAAGEAVYTGELDLAWSESGEPPAVQVPRNLQPGAYTALVTGTVTGQAVHAEQAFRVSGH